MVFLGSVELLCGQNLSNNLPVQELLLPLLGLQCSLLLLRCVEVYSGSVLCPNIVPLAIERGRVVAGPEGIKQVLVAARLGVELNPNDLGVVGGAGADVVVRRIVKVALRISDLGLRHAGDSLEGQFDAPEAAGAELGELLAGGGNVVVGALGDGGGGGVHGGVGGGASAEAELAEPAHLGWRVEMGRFCGGLGKGVGLEGEFGGNP